MAFLRIKPGKDLSVFLVCLFIAVLFWLLNAYSKDYTTQISFPVRYVDIPEDQILTSNPPKEIKASLNGFGFRLLSYSLFSSHDSISLSFSEGTLRPSKKYVSSYLDGNTIETQLRSVVPGDLNLVRVYPDTIRMVVESEVSRQIPVKPQVVFELDKEFFLKGKIQATPAYITVKGPGSLLDKTDSITTEVIDLGVLDKKLVKDVAVKLPAGLSSQTQQITLSVPVEQYTEGELELFLSVKESSLADSLDLVLIPSKVSVKYLVGLSDFKKINAQMFSFTVDPNQAGEGKRFLIVQPEKVPEGVKLLEYSPHKVEYFIRN
ncbi:YbbR-like domain-containing protein [bacterium SCSIO 12741]|nr:YbbR-like domain-containing protein [bacterium SCSIO 12741]